MSKWTHRWLAELASVSGLQRLGAKSHCQVCGLTTATVILTPNESRCVECADWYYKICAERFERDMKEIPTRLFRRWHRD